MTASRELWHRPPHASRLQLEPCAAGQTNRRNSIVVFPITSVSSNDNKQPSLLPLLTTSLSILSLLVYCASAHVKKCAAPASRQQCESNLVPAPPPKPEKALGTRLCERGGYGCSWLQKKKKEEENHAIVTNGSQSLVLSKINNF